jgi:hypothetical protein
LVTAAFALRLVRRLAIITRMYALWVETAVAKLGTFDLRLLWTVVVPLFVIASFTLWTIIAVGLRRLRTGHAILRLFALCLLGTRLMLALSLRTLSILRTSFTTP